MTEQEIFDRLIVKLSMAYDQSDAKENFKSEKWFYALCDTSIKKGVGIVSGINWYGKSGDEYFPQKNHPTYSGERDYPVLAPVKPILDKVFKLTINDVNYTNLCHFRTEKSGQLTPKDYALCTTIFLEYVDLIQPPWIIQMGRPERLWSSLGSLITMGFGKSNSERYAYKAKLLDKYPFYCFPHPSGWNRKRQASQEAYAWIYTEICKDFPDLFLE